MANANQLPIGDIRRMVNRRALLAGQNKINSNADVIAACFEKEKGTFTTELQSTPPEKNLYAPTDKDDEHYQQVVYRVGDYFRVIVKHATGNETQAEVSIDTGGVPVVGRLKELVDMMWSNALKLSKMVGADA